MMENKQKVLQCYSCGNETLMNLVGEHRSDWGCPEDLHETCNYQLYICPICGKPTLLETYWNECQQRYTYNGEIEDYEEHTILFPVSTIKTNNLPVEVKSAFESALKTKNIDTAVCLIALRRTLEIVCKEKGAVGHNLWKKIEDLSNKGILPPELKHASVITKTYGNMGAHDADISTTKQELEQVIEFVQYILDYLYILPAKINKIQEKMARAKDEEGEE
ncbi:MAG: DUF4145 domain-containing protein [Bacillota bacterium]|nr:DUF4145 domain-containing protein [Bacillota bacterium]